MSVALIDDQLLGTVLRGRRPRVLARKELYTTGHWYVRLCLAVLGAHGRAGVLSGPFAELPDDLRTRSLDALLTLPEEIGLVSLRELGPVIARLRRHRQLDILGIEALAAARLLGAQVILSVPSPRLEAALAEEDLTARIHPPV